MLTKSKKRKLLSRIKTYHNQYLRKKLSELDESGTRLMVNTFLTDVLGFAPIEEVKTEYMIKGTYADYVVQTDRNRHFLVEVKSLSLNLSDKHLRQAVNYGANEGIEWALLTNGRTFELYRIIFGKPIESKRVLSVNLGDRKSLKMCADQLQHLHRESVLKKGLEGLWNRCLALDPSTISTLFSAPQIVRFVRRSLKKKFKTAFSDEEVIASIKRVIEEPVPLEGKRRRLRNPRRRRKSKRGKSTDGDTEDIATNSTDSTR